MKPLRVLLVAPLPPPTGGICKWTEIVLEELRRRGDVEVSVVDISPRWRTVHQLEWWRRVIGGSLQLLNDARRVWGAVRQEKPEVLHLCTAGQIGTIRDLFVFGIAKLYRIPTAYHFHFGRIPELARSGGAEWRLIRSACSMADVVFALDAATTASLQRLRPAGSVVQLPNGLNLENLGASVAGIDCPDDRRPGVLRVTFVGHVKEPKGVRELVLAAQRLSGELALEVEVIGPPDRLYVAGIVAEVGAFASSILFRGEWSHAQAMESMRQTDVLALPSYTEGFPYVVLEAMALGKPVVGTDVGAIAEMLEARTERACGLVVPPRDTEALSRALRAVLGDPGLATRLGRCGQLRFQNHYTAAVVVDQLCAVWAGLAAPARCRC